MIREIGVVKGGLHFMAVRCYCGKYNVVKVIDVMGVAKGGGREWGVVAQRGVRWR